jgi:hypothetical protein
MIFPTIPQMWCPQAYRTDEVARYGEIEVDGLEVPKDCDQRTQSKVAYGAMKRNFSCLPALDIHRAVPEGL